MNEPAIEEVEKRAWLNGPGHGSYVEAYALNFPEFFNSSCLLTAAVLRYRWTKQLHWKHHWSSEDGSGSFDLTDFPMLQLSFGQDGDYDDHHLMIRRGTMYQSFYRKSKWDVRPLSFLTLPGRKLSTRELDQLTGFYFSQPLHCCVSIPF